VRLLIDSPDVRVWYTLKQMANDNTGITKFESKYVRLYKNGGVENRIKREATTNFGLSSITFLQVVYKHRIHKMLNTTVPVLMITLAFRIAPATSPPIRS
jgi:hypothetical protein